MTIRPSRQRMKIMCLSDPWRDMHMHDPYRDMPGCERRRDYRDVFDPFATWDSDEDYELGEVLRQSQDCPRRHGGGPQTPQSGEADDAGAFVGCGNTHFPWVPSGRIDARPPTRLQAKHSVWLCAG